jgi:hypothetical protein
LEEWCNRFLNRFRIARARQDCDVCQIKRLPGDEPDEAFSLDTALPPFIDRTKVAWFLPNMASTDPAVEATD